MRGSTIEMGVIPNPLDSVSHDDFQILTFEVGAACPFLGHSRHRTLVGDEKLGKIGGGTMSLWVSRVASDQSAGCFVLRFVDNNPRLCLGWRCHLLNFVFLVCAFVVVGRAWDSKKFSPLSIEVAMRLFGNSLRTK